jgi:tRNA (guanine-N(7)-)-methyltransferase
MPRRKTEYRDKLLAEPEYTVVPGRPLVLPEGMPATIEVGMGSGRILVARAAAEPERFFVGVELKEERTWQAVREARKLGLRNVRFIALPIAKADEFLPASRFDELVILFPDPWPRDRDERRRLVAPQNLRLYARWLKTGARCIFRTDSPALFAYGRETIAARGFPIHAAESDVPPGAISTKYEAIWRAKRLAIHQVIFERPALLPDDPLLDAPRPSLSPKAATATSSTAFLHGSAAPISPPTAASASPTAATSAEPAAGG